YALALSISPTLEDFVHLMNEKAKSLGADSTVYTNPTGIDDSKGQTTVRDVAKIAAYAAANKEYIKYSSCERYEMAPTNMVGVRTIANKNWLVSRSYVEKYYLPYVTGLNAGSTVKGGECCVASATKDGVTMIVVVMYASTSTIPTTNLAFADAKNMLKWAYSAYGYEKVLSKSDIVCEIPVSLSSSRDYVALLPEEDIYAFMPTDVDITSEVECKYTLDKQELTAPVAEGQKAGQVTVYYKGKELGKTALVTKNALSKSAALTLWTNVKGFLFNFWTVAIAILLLAFFVIVIIANAYIRGRRNR
ncbi:MAG: D-alanyl-D-alanine carboxypeptidase, partial [Oscillospiraceae bacterium]|nr:D-alanyl-D-alanine carboxypeptidase [Oscillospiraceae bacterium]